MQSKLPSGPEANNEVGVNNNVEAEMIGFIVERNEQSSNDRGVGGTDKSIEWVVESESLQEPRINSHQLIISNESNMSGHIGCSTSEHLGPINSHLNLAQFEDQARRTQNENSVGSSNFQQENVEALANVNGPSVNNGLLDPLLISLLGQNGISVNVLRNGDTPATFLPHPAKDKIPVNNVQMEPNPEASPESTPLGGSPAPCGSPCVLFTENVRQKNPIHRRDQNRAKSHGIRMKSYKPRGRPHKNKTSTQCVVDPSDSDIIRCNDVFLENIRHCTDKGEGRNSG